MQYPPPGPPTKTQGQGPGYDQGQWQGAQPGQTGPPPYQEQGASANYYAGSPPPQNYSQYPAGQQGYGYNNPFPPQQAYAVPGQQWAYPPPPAGATAYGSQLPGVTYNSRPVDVKQEDPAGGGLPTAESEKERGLLGALAGGAAGGYAGHKVNHGFLGAVGGAYAGHKVQDAWKDHHHHSKPPSPQPPSGHKHGMPVHTPHTLGNFSQSSSKVTLDRDYDLIAECANTRGGYQLSSMSLNSVLTNSNGRFRWVDPKMEEGNFGASARNVRLLGEGKFLEAELADINGHWRWDRICLDERIENSDGDLRKI